MRNGVFLLLVVALLGLTAAPAGADGPATTRAASTAAAAPDYAPLAATRLPSRCASAGAAAIVVPGQDTLAVGATPGSLGASAYPAGSPVVGFAGADVAGAACRPGPVSVRALSLFGGAVTADAVSASAGRGSVTNLRIEGTAVTLGAGESAPVEGWGLVIAGDQIGGTLAAPLALHLLEPHGPLPAGAVVLVGFGAKATPVVVTRPATSAAAKRKKTAQTATTAPAPVTKLVPAGSPAPKTRPAATATTAAAKKTHAKHKRRHKKKHLPLKVTPPLHVAHYVFPVAHGADWVDTYGGPRSDVSNGWHHGDDLFAPLGTPVVAVASGTLSLVGWNEIGGWRVWLEDEAGNEFYYAHLAGYSRWILKHPHVREGQVIGFLGRTGDAFTTSPHLHFEVHPRQLFRLGYDGAVDPSSYLRTWKIVWPKRKDLPRPARLRAPKGAPRIESAVVWRQLMAKQRQARGLANRTIQPPHAFPRGDGLPAPAAAALPAGVAAAERTAARVAAPRGGGPGTWALLLVAGIAGAGTVAPRLLRRLARRRG